MARKKTWSRKVVSADIFVNADDIREILEVHPPVDTADENGEPVHRCGFFVIAGPQGGQFRLRLPDWYWAEIDGQVVAGDGIDNGGWQGGKFVRPNYWQ